MEELKKLIGSHVVYSPVISRITGSINSAIFLSQLMYWWERKSNGLLYKTVDEIEKETTLTRYHQEAAVKKLVKMEFIEIYMMGLPRKRHFGINLDNIKKAVSDFSTNKNAENPPTSTGKTNEQVRGNSPDKFVEKPPSSTGKNPELERGKTTQQYVEKPRAYTKITTNTTTGTTSNITTENTFFICGEKISPSFKKFNFSDFEIEKVDRIAEIEKKEIENQDTKQEKKEINPPNLRAAPLDKDFQKEKCRNENRFEQNNSKKKQKENSLHLNMKNIFIEIYKTKIGMPYCWSGKDGKHLSEIIEKMRYMLQQMQKVPDEASVTDSFRLLLENIQDQWILEHFTIAIINSKFNEILLKINGQSERSKNGRFSISAEYERSLQQRLYGKTV